MPLTPLEQAEQQLERDLSPLEQADRYLRQARGEPEVDPGFAQALDLIGPSGGLTETGEFVQGPPVVPTIPRRPPRYQWRSMGPRGPAAVAAETRWAEKAPVIGGFLEWGRRRGFRRAVQQLRAHDAGEIELLPTVRHSFATTVRDALEEIDYLQARGTGFWGEVTGGVIDMIPWMAEFTMSAGLTSAAAGGMRALTGRVLGRYAAHGLGQAMTRLSGGLASATTRTGTVMAGRVLSAAEQRRLPRGIAIGPEGQVSVEAEGMGPASAFVAGLGETFIEALTEEAGGAITEFPRRGVRAVVRASRGLRRVRVAVRGLRNRIRQALSRGWVASGRSATTFNARFAQAGFHGMVGEIGEERLSDILREVFGLRDEGPLTARQLLVEATVLMFPGAVRFTANQWAVSQAVGQTVQGERDRLLQENTSGAMRFVTEMDRAGRLEDVRAVAEMERPARSVMRELFGRDLRMNADQRAAFAGMLRENLAFLDGAMEPAKPEQYNLWRVRETGAIGRQVRMGFLEDSADGTSRPAVVLEVGDETVTYPVEDLERTEVPDAEAAARPPGAAGEEEGVPGEAVPEVRVRGDEAVRVEAEPGEVRPPEVAPEVAPVSVEVTERPPEAPEVEPTPTPGPEAPVLEPEPLPETPDATRVYNVAPDVIQVDPDRFQFKEIYGPTGTSAVWKIQQWDPYKGGVLLVWKDPADGQTYVVNGHHRLREAKRLGVPAVAVRYIAASTAAQARAVGAMTNIAEGRGTELDAAKVFRDQKLTIDDLRGEGLPLSERLVQRGLALANLDPELFKATVREEIPLERAVIIGRELPRYEDQRALLDLLKDRRLSNLELSELISEVASAPRVEETQTTLFGRETVRKNLAVPKARLRAWVKRELSRRAQAFEAVTKRGRADLLKQEGVAEVDVPAAKRLATSAKILHRTFDRLVRYKGRLQEALNAAARLTLSGGKQNKIREDLYREVQEALQEELRGGGRADTAAPSGRGPQGAAFAYHYQGELPAPGEPQPDITQRRDPDAVVVELPEIVELVEHLLAGRFPYLRRRLAGRAVGVFGQMAGVGSIGLQRDIFIGPQIASLLAKRGEEDVLEAAGREDLAKKHDLAEADIHVTRERDRKTGRTRLRFYRIDPSFAPRVLAHELGHLTDWLPQKTLKRGNVLGRIASFKDYLKHWLEAMPESAVKILTEQERRRLRYHARKTAQQELGREADPDALKARTRTLYAEQLQAEIDRRGLHSRDQIVAELKALTTWWHPFNPATADEAYVKYRYSAKELYAEAISVLLNNPAALRARAPRFHKALFAWFGEKPEVKSIYDAITARIHHGAAGQERERRLQEMFDEGDKAYRQSVTQTRGLKADLVPGLKYLLVDVHAAPKHVAARGRRAGKIQPEKDPEYAIEHAVYSGSESELYVADIRNRIRDRLEDANLDYKDLRAYLFHRRVANERKLLANPLGWTSATSQQALDALRMRLGETKWNALQAVAEAFWEIRQEFIVEKARAANIYSPELMEKLADNESYVTFDVQKYVEERHGRAAGGRIYRQIGTLEKITDPMAATLMKDLSLIRSINWNVAKRATVDALLEMQPESIKKAQTRWTGSRQRFIDPTDPAKRLLLFMHEGKLQGYYVDKWIAAGFQRGDDLGASVAAKVFHAMAAPFRMLFTGVNPGFFMFNARRDFRRMMKNAPGAKYVSRDPAWVKWLQAWPAAWRRAHGVTDEITREMLKGNMLISVADPRGLRSHEKQFERLLAMYNLEPGQWQKRVTNPFRWFFYEILRIGETIETVPKIAGYRHLKEAFPEMSMEEIAHRVRTQIGSPSFLTKGRASPILNNVLLYSNAFTQAWRSDISAWREQPGEKLWKLTKYTFIPKAIQWALYSGALVWTLKQIGFKDDDDAVLWARSMQDMYRNVSEYDLTNYLCIPLGVTPGGRTAYIRLPYDEEERFLGGIFWKILNAEEVGFESLPSILDYTAGQFPSLNPAIRITGAVVEYLSGQNPYDHFRGRPVLPETLFEAHSRETHIRFAKWLANEAGVSIVHRFRSGSAPAVATELERILNLPLLSNMVGRFVKVSNRGTRQMIDRLKRDERRRRAREILHLRKLIRKQVRGGDLTEEEQELLRSHREYTRRRTPREEARAQDQVWRSAYLEAASTAEKDAIARRWLELQPSPAAAVAETGTVGHMYATRQLWALTAPRSTRQSDESLAEYNRRLGRHELSVAHARQAIQQVGLSKEQTHALLPAAARSHGLTARRWKRGRLTAYGLRQERLEQQW